MLSLEGLLLQSWPLLWMTSSCLLSASCLEESILQVYAMLSLRHQEIYGGSSHLLRKIHPEYHQFSADCTGDFYDHPDHQQIPPKERREHSRTGSCWAVWGSSSFKRNTRPDIEKWEMSFYKIIFRLKKRYLIFCHKNGTSHLRNRGLFTKQQGRYTVRLLALMLFSILYQVSCNAFTSYQNK